MPKQWLLLVIVQRGESVSQDYLGKKPQQLHQQNRKNLKGKVVLQTLFPCQPRIRCLWSSFICIWSFGLPCATVLCTALEKTEYRSHLPLHDLLWSLSPRIVRSCIFNKSKIINIFDTFLQKKNIKKLFLRQVSK